MLDRDTMREYMRTKRSEWREQGLCPLCGYERDNEKYKCCGRCREQARVRNRGYRRANDGRSKI